MKKLFALTMILALCLSSVCCTAVADELPPLCNFHDYASDQRQCVWRQ